MGIYWFTDDSWGEVYMAGWMTGGRMDRKANRSVGGWTGEQVRGTGCLEELAVGRAC